MKYYTYMNSLTLLNFRILNHTKNPPRVWVLVLKRRTLRFIRSQTWYMIKPFIGNSRAKIWKIIDGIYEKLISIQMEMKPNMLWIFISIVQFTFIRHSDQFIFRILGNRFEVWCAYIHKSLDWIPFLNGEISPKLNHSKRQNEDNRRNFFIR